MITTIKEFKAELRRLSKLNEEHLESIETPDLTLENRAEIMEEVNKEIFGEEEDRFDIEEEAK